MSVTQLSIEMAELSLIGVVECRILWLRHKAASVRSQ